MDLYSRKASFDEVKQDPKAVTFHADRYEGGQRDKLAKLCWQVRRLNAGNS